MLWDLSSLAFGQGTSVLLGFVAFAYLARTLPAEAYGAIEYVVVLIGVAAIVVEGGLGAIGTLGVARDPAKASELAGRIPGARLLLALLVVPLVGLSSSWAGFAPNVTALTWLFAASLFAVAFKQDWLLQGLERMRAVPAAQVLKSAAFALGVILLVDGSDDLVRVGTIEVVAAVIGAVYFAAVQRRLSIPWTVDLRWSSAWPLVRAGASVGASNIIWPFMLYAPILMVTKLAGAAEAAWMGGVQRIVVALVSFSALYFVNLYPLIAHTLNSDRPRWRRFMTSSVRVIAWASIGAALVIALAAEWIVTAVFGEAYRPASPVLSLYIWLLPLRLLSGHARWTLLAAERQGMLLFAEVACASILVALSAALVPVYGARGAAAAALAGNIATWLLAHECVRRYVGSLPELREVVFPIGAATAAVGATILLNTHPALETAVAAAVYALCMRVIAPELLGDAVRLAYAKRSVSEVPPVTNY